MEKTLAFCKMCKGVVGVERLLDLQGNVFCSEDCYESYSEMMPGRVGEICDYEHPYYDDYRVLRLDYIVFFKNDWRKELQDAHDGGEVSQWLADEMIENIDRTIIDYIDYYRSEGMDGFFSMEIYNYLKSMQSIQQEMFQWRPQYKTYYLIQAGEHDYTDMKHLVEELEIVGCVFNNYWEHQIIFADYTEFKVALNKIEDFIDRHLSSDNEYIWSAETYKCPCCNTASDIMDYCDQNTRWFYCDSDSCGQFGQYNAKETIEVIKSSYHERSRNSNYDEEKERRKVRRSCIQHGIALPLWADPYYLWL